MNRENQPWWPVTTAKVQWHEDGTPYSPRFQDVYYSRDDGMAESEHVFLAGNRLRERWMEASGHQAFCIGETGFGTGLNFLLTWLRWRTLPEPRPRLHYLSIEKYPLSRDDMARALSHWTPLATLAKQLLAAWPGATPGQHRLVLEQGELILDLWWEDIAEALRDLAPHGNCVDAWFLDGFAPARNESMWQPSLFDQLAALSNPGATFATFTAAGHVRRGLAEAGFTVSKVPGFGRKRESLSGYLSQTAPAPAPDATPWDLRNVRPQAPASAIVVGAGLAGCHTAASLARRGVAVTLLEANVLAGAASGNEQGILYTRLSRQHSPLTDFALQSFRFASSHYRTLFTQGDLRPGVDGELCGSFHELDDDEELTLMSERLASAPELARVLARDEAAEVLGVKPSRRGYWYPDSGWLHPPAICKALASAEGVALVEHCGEVTLQRTANQWQATRAGEALAEADVAIICTGGSYAAFPSLQWLPLQSIRGQTTHLPGNEEFAQLRAAFCHEGYIAPARQGLHCIGATFNLRNPDTALRAEDHQHNLDKLAHAVPQWRDAIAGVTARGLPGRVGFRCASPDYLPVAGPVPDRNAFLQTYAGLRKNARQLLPARGPYMEGLYVNTAHGSRGLTSTPLVAEWLSSLVCGEPPPISRELQRAISPARFLVRDLARNRV